MALRLLRRGLSSRSPHKFPLLFQPLTLPDCGITLKNRIIMGSMYILPPCTHPLTTADRHTGLEEPGFLGDLSEMAEFYATRARGGVGLIVTGGIAPNSAGRVTFGAAKMSTRREAHHHQLVTEAVHANGGRIAMQILHAGRYSYHLSPVSASAVKSPISWFTPHALTSQQVQQTIDDYVKSAVLAKLAGYDGVEIMGSEGYLINQFIVRKTNKRNDEWGGSYANRIRFPVEIVRRTRAAVGRDFLIIYRLSMLDLVDEGSTWEEVVELAKAIEAAGASIINTGIGWHEGIP